MLFTFQQTTKAQSPKPNIILILSDDIGYGTLTVNGGKSYSTPNLDSMAHNGMNFTQCHASPLCSPSRFLLLTGKYNFRNYTQWGIMDTSQRTIGNMFKDAGYKTACFGKWQLDGGDISVHKFGFDEYCLYNAFVSNERGSRYKDPEIYTDGEYLSKALTQDKYGEDIVMDSLFNFMDENKANPFFIYYPMLLAHAPFQPTPDDADFIKWNSVNGSDTSYYPSMIKYMDKKVGQLINKLKQLKIENNTVVIYVGDNGTPTEISQYINDDSLIVGGKGATKENGIHVPMIIYWPGVITAGTTNNNLIGFTDFLPTLAEIAHITVPKYFEPMDGISFSPSLINKSYNSRSWLFYDYNPHPDTTSLKRWAETTTYKLYDTSAKNSTRLFYNIKNDINEKKPLSFGSLTVEEIAIKQQLLNIINGYVAQGFPIFRGSVLSDITDSSVKITDSIDVNGGSTVTSSGAVWNTVPNPVISSSPFTTNGKPLGLFKALIRKLKANTTYYVRAYATNFAGTAYSNQLKFKTLLPTPVALEATSIDNIDFVANWHSVTAATNYKMDVSINPSFTTTKPSTIIQQFDNGLIPPDGWTFSKNIGINDIVYKDLSPSLQFKATNARITTNILNGVATELQFWIKGINTDNISALLVEGFDGTAWTVIKNINNLPLTGTTQTFNATSITPLKNKFIQFRFTYTKSSGSLVFDDVSIKYNRVISSFVNGYDGLKVNDTAFTVTGLNAATNYYYRVRAVTDFNTSKNSNIISVATCALKNCHGNKPNIIQSITKSSLLNVNVFPNPTSNEFTLTIKSISDQQTKIFVTDVFGKKIYQASGNNKKYIFGKGFSSGIYFVKIIQGEDIRTFKLIMEK